MIKLIMILLLDVLIRIFLREMISLIKDANDNGDTLGEITCVAENVPLAWVTVLIS